MFHFKPAVAQKGALAHFLICMSVSMWASDGFAASVGSKGRDLLKRAETREAKRWTLQDWLEQRDRGRMMDLWLSLNSPSPYEFVLGGSHNGYALETAASTIPVQHTSYAGAFSAYAQIVGVSVEYENNAEEKFQDLNGLLNLRLFGDSIQSSYLTVHFGQRTRTYAEPSVRVAQLFSQASLQLYAMRAFGVAGLYRIYYPAEMKTETASSVTSGHLAEIGAFIDFKNFRLFGDWYKEQTINRTAESAETAAARTGIKTGIKIFF